MIICITGEGTEETHILTTVGALVSGRALSAGTGDSGSVLSGENLLEGNSNSHQYFAGQRDLADYSPLSHKE